MLTCTAASLQYMWWRCRIVGLQNSNHLVIPGVAPPGRSISMENLKSADVIWARNKTSAVTIEGQDV
jgi:hypothetical protein